MKLPYKVVSINWDLRILGLLDRFLTEKYGQRIGASSARSATVNVWIKSALARRGYFIEADKRGVREQ